MGRHLSIDFGAILMDLGAKLGGKIEPRKDKTGQDKHVCIEHSTFYMTFISIRSIWNSDYECPIDNKLEKYDLTVSLGKN